MMTDGVVNPVGFRLLYAFFRGKFRGKYVTNPIEF